ncbi:hypothetical protein PPO43_10775 [Saprospira sp. CCB-QB6]|uniref:hypothetical protein n=1 Tax=Saprospira sp. CCB-QB6 TaxID=3023936 RepID=UPI00234B8127|nr:hypothetical protein [Saprospira sp. CCB-QB6]WCL80452.1 hypothetical protein PPO43_10775 [Saprospira sp. CCB-QB6]
MKKSPVYSPDELAKILLLEEYSLPYDYEDGQLLLTEETAENLAVLLQKEQEEGQRYEIFAEFDYRQMFDNLCAFLDAQKIPYKIWEKQQDPGEDYARAPALKDSAFYVYLRLVDFESTQALLREEAKAQSIYKEADYHLRRYSDEELMEILERPEDWQVLDVVAARYLLNERGHNITEEEVELMRQHRMIELRQPRKLTAKERRDGYLSAIFLGPLGLFWGYHYYSDRRLLPNGRKVLNFAPQARAEGIQMMMISLSWSLLLGLILYYLL